MRKLRRTHIVFTDDIKNIGKPLIDCFFFCLFLYSILLAMSKAAVKISGDLLSNPLCEQDQAFLESMTALDTAMKRMDAFNQEKVRL